MKQNKLKFGIAAATAFGVMACSIVPVNAAPFTNSTAATTATQEIKADGQAACSVYAEVGSSFQVSVPKTITLDGATKSGSYTVSCSGDIAGVEYVIAKPDVSFAMSQDGKADVTAAITQEKDAFRSNTFSGTLAANENKMADAAAGAISAEQLTAGSWNGAFNFEIALKTDVAEAN